MTEPKDKKKKNASISLRHVQGMYNGFMCSGYQKEVWKRVVEKIKGQFGNYALLIFLAELIAVVLVYGYQYFNVGGESAKSSFIEGICLILVFNLVVLILLIPYLRYFQIPNEIYDFQKEKIDRFWPQELRLAIFERPYTKIIDSRDSVELELLSLEVYNNNPTIRIDELEAELRTATRTGIIDVDYHRQRGIVSTPFAPEIKLYWENGGTQISLRPGEPACLYLCGLDQTREDNIAFFGMRDFVNYMFAFESIFEPHIVFSGKREGEIEFRRFNLIKAIYSNPKENTMLFGDDALERKENLPQDFIDAINAVKEGYSYFKKRE